MGIRIILALVGCLSAFAYGDTIHFEHQYDGKIELYSEENLLSPSGIMFDAPKYIRQDKIFIVPYAYNGESELYDVSFYIDLSYPIETEWEKNSYRIRYAFLEDTMIFTHIDISNEIPEPTTCFSLLCFIPLIITRKK